MSAQGFLVAILGFGLLNGIFSPYRLMAQFIIVVLAPGFFLDSPSVVLLLSSLLTATATIMFGGVPAAIYERLRGETESSMASLWIWIATTAIISLPAVQVMIAMR
ncbi:MAG: hypothetical protein KDJ16_09185 [Hyphomicrobiales bacterium]|nr:hypothetical protein [Hyphomicrobiales bacterium]